MPTSSILSSLADVNIRFFIINSVDLKYLGFSILLSIIATGEGVLYGIWGVIVPLYLIA